MGAIRYDRANLEYSEITSGTILDWSQDATWMFWVYPSSEPAFTIFGIASAWTDTSNWWRLRCTDLITGNDDLILEVEATGSLTDEGTAVLNSGTWTHIAIVRSGNDWTVYVDAVADVTVTGKDLTGATTKIIEGNTYDPNTSGAAHTSDSFDGRFTGRKAWQAALTEQEIRSEMQLTSPLRVTNLFEYWPTVSSTNRAVGYARGINWTEVNTPTDEAGIELPWGDCGAELVLGPTAVPTIYAVDPRAGVLTSFSGQVSPATVNDICSFSYQNTKDYAYATNTQILVVSPRSGSTVRTLTPTFSGINIPKLMGLTSNDKVFYCAVQDTATGPSGFDIQLTDSGSNFNVNFNPVDGLFVLSRSGTVIRSISLTGLAAQVRQLCWAKNRLYLLRKSGTTSYVRELTVHGVTVQETQLSASDTYSGIAWDGQNFWVSNETQNRLEVWPDGFGAKLRDVTVSGKTVKTGLERDPRLLLAHLL